MNSKTKCILLTLAISVVGLLVFNSYKAYYWYSIVPELEYSKIIFGIGILSFGLFYFAKKWGNGLTKIMFVAFGICLILNLYLIVEYYKTLQTQNRLSEYYELETCKKMENRFATDLKKREIKYFHFGLGSIIGMENVMKSNYNIEYYSMGCLLRSEMECYNKLVDEYLKENYNKSISDIHKEIGLE
ncbi:FEKKY domain-containing protein [Aquimarina macrocephali]|uniref:FEKKY domain-containing protein n=1 Tax=Aquimarina macrocephali TaxID=666563 RepID=UPI0004679346|nr:hypothetical protein [Aquimarina macrocephali]